MTADDPRLAVVLDSPRCVAAHDRAGWLALFAPDGVVEDPVGGTPRRGHAALARFWEVFIAKNTIRFEVHGDFVFGNEVVRDVDLHVVFPSGAAIRVPAYLRYVTTGGPAAPLLARLEAYWELGTQLRQLTLAGLRGLWASTVTSLSMAWHLGPLALLDYLKVVFGVGRGGHRALAALSAALSRGDRAAARACFVEDASVDLPEGETEPVSVVLEGDGALALAVERPISAGRTTVFRYRLERGGEIRRGVGFARFPARGVRIERLRFFSA